MAEPRPTAAVVTVSDGVAQGTRDDASGRAVASLLAEAGFEVAERHVVPDERAEIETLLRDLAGRGVRLVATTGGTGLGPRDVTPEATRAVLDRQVPGLEEAMRAAGRASTPFADLSRGLVGAAGRTLVVNLPGSSRGATESLGAILPVLSHALELLAGHTAHGPADAEPAPAAEAAGGEPPSGEPSRHDHTGHGQGIPARQARTPAGSVEDLLAERRAAGEEVVVATAVRTEGSPPCRVGQKILLGRGGALAGTLGCAEFDDAAIADAPGILDARGPATATYVHDLGTVEVLLEPYLRRPLLVVLSATPVARNLLRWASDLGFDPVLVEPRAERLAALDEPSSGGTSSTGTARLAGGLGELRLDAETSVVHTDHDAPFVVETLAELLRSPARFVGVMGSARHVGPHLERLRELGFGDRDLARIRTPVGIDLGARTAEEIALSILAGVVADRRGAGGGWLDRPGR